MEIRLDAQLPEEEATHIQIRIVYQRSLSGATSAHTEVAFAGVKPAGYTPRVTCGLLFIALGCFDVVYGVSSEPIPEGYTDKIVVATQTRQIFATNPTQAGDVISDVISFHAKELGISPELMTQTMIARLVGEAVEVLNGTAPPAKVNAAGGSA